MGKATEPRNRGGTSLYVVHRILIGAAVILGAIMVMWGVMTYAQGGGASPLLVAVLGGACVVGLSWYLRWFTRKH